jgi:hypothetical protein
VISGELVYRPVTLDVKNQRAMGPPQSEFVDTVLGMTDQM